MEDWALISGDGPGDVVPIGQLATFTEDETDPAITSDAALGVVEARRATLPSVPASAFLNVAKAQVGYAEGPRNDNMFGVWYGWNNQPYCAMGLSWVAAQIGAAELIGGKWAYCPYWADWFRKKGQWSTTPAVGDIVFFDWTGKRQPGKECHVGVVIGVKPGYVETVEFNTVKGTGSQSDGGGVFIRTRAISTTVGFGRPKWATVTASTPIAYKGHEILTVDGAWGAKTTRRLQEVLRVARTGKLDVITIPALAVWLRQKPVTAITPLVKVALQSRLGVKKDGVIGVGTIKALQKYLNRL